MYVGGESGDMGTANDVNEMRVRDRRQHWMLFEGEPWLVSGGKKPEINIYLSA